MTTKIHSMMWHPQKGYQVRVSPDSLAYELDQFEARTLNEDAYKRCQLYPYTWVIVDANQVA